MSNALRIDDTVIVTINAINNAINATPSQLNVCPYVHVRTTTDSVEYVNKMLQTCRPTAVMRVD